LQPYVRLNYVPVRGLKDYCDMIRLVSGALDKDQQAASYVEATVFSKNEAVIMTGEFTDCDTDDDKRKVCKNFTQDFSMDLFGDPLF
jgi:Delta24-sterol reductase